MKLLTSLTSPYGRKLRILALELELALEVVETAPMQDGAALLAVNPIGKVPVLVLDDGSAILDSPVIAAYLLSLAPGNNLLATDGSAHWQGLTTEAMADGIVDAAMILRFNAGQDVNSGLWVDRQYRAIDRSLAALADRIDNGFGFAEICAVVACEYLDMRFAAIDWRGSQPKLAALQARLTGRPSFAVTRPPVA